MNLTGTFTATEDGDGIKLELRPNLPVEDHDAVLAVVSALYGADARVTD